MKTAITLFAVFSCLVSSALSGEVKTLAGFNDSVTLKKGQVAYVLGVSENMIVQFEKDQQWPPRPVQFRLGVDHCHHGYTTVVRRPQVIPSIHRPFVLSGPGKLSVKTGGVVTVKVTDGGGK